MSSALSEYSVFGWRMRADGDGFVEALAAAYAERHRPRCLCTAQQPQMYVSRCVDRYILKRMPCTGSRHAPTCRTFGVVADVVAPDHETGLETAQTPAEVTTLWPAFAMWKRDAQDRTREEAGAASSTRDEPRRLSLGALLASLWDQAELTHWHPGFAGRRSWAVIRKHLLDAARGKTLGGRSLQDLLFIPETFSVQRREALDERRVAKWKAAAPRRSGIHPLMLLVGELKDIRRTSFGMRAKIKHLPDQLFALSDELYQSVCRRSSWELSQWAENDRMHVATIATFMLDDTGVPSIEEMSLMATCAEWIPVEDRFELRLVDRLLRARRDFIKRLQVDPLASGCFVAAELLDTADSPSALRIARPGAERAECDWSGLNPSWVWRIGEASMPLFPSRRGAADRALPSIAQKPIEPGCVAPGGHDRPMAAGHAAPESPTRRETLSAPSGMPLLSEATAA